jgi:hypothetical protein
VSDPTFDLYHIIGAVAEPSRPRIVTTAEEDIADVPNSRASGTTRERQL